MKSRLVKKELKVLMMPGNNIIVTAGMFVHKLCRMNYIHKRDIEKRKRAKSDCTSSVKISARLITGPFDSQSDCLFCGRKVVKKENQCSFWRL